MSRVPVLAVSLLLVLPCCCACAQAIVPPGQLQLTTTTAKGPKSDREVQEEVQLAGKLSEQNKLPEAVALMQDALQQRPANGAIAEAFASIETHFAALSEGDAKKQHLIRTQQLLEMAAKNGDNSPHVQVMQEATNNALRSFTSPAAPNTDSPATQALNQAEKRFSQGDMQAALALYEKALQLNPKYYEAALYEGDAYFKMKRNDDAKRMYANAVAIDPNRDVAYRFWGDVLMTEGKYPEAEDKVIEGILCEPYTRATWAYLDGWARASDHKLGSPDIKTPAPPKADIKNPSNLTINVNPAGDKDPSTGPWMAYQIVLAASMLPKDGKAARHSLEVEAAALRAALQAAKDAKVVDKVPTFKLLSALDQDGMLESWILLNHADEDITHDLVAYRNQHRALMHAYVAKYVVHNP